MGANLSQEEEGSSHQTQPPITTPPRPQTTIPQTTSTSSNNNNNNHSIQNVNNGSNGRLEKKSSFQKSQSTRNIPIIPPISVEATNNNNSKGKQEKVLVNNNNNDNNKLPHNYEAIIKESDSPLNTSSPQNLYDRLYAGIYLNGRTKKYWVEKKGHINCFMVFASGLSISWSGDNRYWQWHHVETSIAALKNVCWLEVHGKLNTANLTPGVTYQVAYIIKLEYTSYGWEVPVNLRLVLPNGTKQEHKEKFNDKPRDEWVRIPVGEFKTSQDNNNNNNVGDIEFSLYEYEGGHWKSGLVIKGVTIEPKLVG